MRTWASDNGKSGEYGGSGMRRELLLRLSTDTYTEFMRELVEALDREGVLDDKTSECYKRTEQIIRRELERYEG